MQSVSPLPYHHALRDLLRQMDKTVWDWFGNQQQSSAALESLKFDLLKSTYRLTPQAHPVLYDAAQFAADALGITAPITLYQAQSESHWNACLASGGDEIHIVFSGDLESGLSQLELRALLGHELGHHLLHQTDDGDHLRSWDILRSICLDAHAHPTFQNSFRKLALYTEAYCDQVAMKVVRQFEPVISTLIKLETGLKSVSPEEFLLQAQEILSKSAGLLSSEAVTHPEPYIRAVALKLAYDNDESLHAKLASYIEGPCDTTSMDLLQQRQLSAFTRALIAHVLLPPSLRSDVMLAHARQYFEDFDPSEAAPTAASLLSLVHSTTWNTESVATYLCYVLLDFATADRSLEEAPWASVLTVAEAWKLKDKLIPMMRKEMKLRKNQIELCDQKKSTILEAAHEVH